MSLKWCHRCAAWELWSAMDCTTEDVVPAPGGSPKARVCSKRKVSFHDILPIPEVEDSRYYTSAFCTSAASSFVISPTGLRARSPAPWKNVCCLSWMLWAVAAGPPFTGPNPVLAVSSDSIAETSPWDRGAPSTARVLSLSLGRVPSAMMLDLEELLISTDVLGTNMRKIGSKRVAEVCERSFLDIIVYESNTWWPSV